MNTLLRLDDPLYQFLEDHQHALRSNNLTQDLFDDFREAVWSYYRAYKRAFPWRETVDPYHIIVSEIMLQQTQTQRVVEKYHQFLSVFPTVESLARASMPDVLAQWVGLGYNRRALALHGIAQKIVTEHGGVLPADPAILQTWKGLGPATASSIVTFAYNTKTTFIETNVRAVFLHAFFAHAESAVDDKLLIPLVALTADNENPREWYYALMDCGVILKKLYPNPSRKSKHHARQSRFEGSDRQIRGAIIRFVLAEKCFSKEQLQETFGEPERAQKIIDQLIKEGFLVFLDDCYFLFDAEQKQA